MARQIGRLVDHRVTEPARGEDLARLLAAATRVEIVAVEIEQHDARSFNPLQQRIEPRRIETPRIVKLVEIAKRGGRCGHDRVHIFGGVGGHQSEERSE